MKMRGDLLHRVFARLLEVSVWGGELVGRSNLPAEGPAVFVGNHAQALGPIAITSSLPIRVWPWVVGDMLDWGLAPAYLRKDFVDPAFRAPDWLAIGSSRLLSQASVRLLQGIECVPVWRDKRVTETYHISVEYLLEGRSLLIFPEDPTLPLDPRSGMRPFMTGFARLGHMYFDLTGERLRFYPVAVLPSKRVAEVAAPVAYNPNAAAAQERVRVARLLESIIRAMVMEEQTAAYAGLPMPR
jgi:hypothetical protein